MSEPHEPLADVQSCALDAGGLRDQGSRYARLASTVCELSREPRALSVEFRAGFDRALLDETLAVERECCPFFGFELDPRRRRLRVSVVHDAHVPALDALAAALSPPAPAPAGSR